MPYLTCKSAVFSCCCSLQWINLTALFKIVCIFLFLVLEAIQSGIDGYIITGIRRVFTSVDFILGVRPLNLLNCYKTPVPLFIVLLIWLTNPCVDILKPRSLPFLHVSISLPFTLMFLVLSYAMGIIWNFSSLVFISKSFQIYLFFQSLVLL